MADQPPENPTVGPDGVVVAHTGAPVFVEPEALPPDLSCFDMRMWDPTLARLSWGVYMAARARAGDTIAAAVLNAFRIQIYDAEHKRYWPPGDDDVRLDQP